MPKMEKMGIEEDISNLKDTVKTLLITVVSMENYLRYINEKIDLLTIRKELGKKRGLKK